MTDVLSAPRWDAADHPVGQLGGYELTAKRQYRDDQPYVLVDVVGVPVDSVAVSVGDTQNPAPGLVVRFENALRSLDRKLASKHEWIDELATEINRAEGELGKPFQHQDALHAAYAARKAVNDQTGRGCRSPTGHHGPRCRSIPRSPGQHPRGASRRATSREQPEHRPAVQPPEAERDTTPGLD
jgi:hypothetical protein